MAASACSTSAPHAGCPFLFFCTHGAAAQHHSRRSGCSRRSPNLRLLAVAASGISQTSSTTLTDAGTLSFLAWADSVRIACPSLKPATFPPHALRGMAAVAPVQADSLLISVPRSAAIVLPPRMRCPFPDWVVPSYWDSVPWFVKMGLLLIHQKQQGPSARLAGYLQQLPRAVDVPVLWDDQTLQQLQYHHLIYQVKEQQVEWSRLCDELRGLQHVAASGAHAVSRETPEADSVSRSSTPTCSQVKEQQVEWSRLYDELQERGLQPTAGSSARGVSRETFFWALTCVRSRTFSGPYVGSTLADRLRLAGVVATLALANLSLGLADAQQTASAAIAVFVFNILYEVILSRSTKQYALCPLIDFINHSSAVESEVSYEYVSDSFSVIASRAYAPGAQVFVNYGQNNDGLMQYYGFTEVDNAKDVYVMTNLLKWLDQVAPAEQRRLDQLNKEGLLNALQIVTVARTGFPADTLQALRFLLAPAAAAASGRAAAELKPAAFASPGTPELEAKLASVLVHACVQELESLGTSMQEDRALLSEARRSRALSPSERSAVAFRLEKKRVVAACLKNLGAEVSEREGADSNSGGEGPGGGSASKKKGFAA